MTQIPYATYNPTASPVQSSVVPFVPAPVPQEVQIGSGIENIGPAFAAFSQTLAGFVANRVSEDREQKMKEGELKVQASRKRFRQLVESGEISPQENPWEALGAAAADGVLAANAFRSKAKAAYDDRVAKDPYFGLSVGGGEEFVNNMLADELAAGMQNPVWQRSFLKEVSPFVSHIGAVHGDNVAKVRRQKISESISTGFTSDVSLFRDEVKNLSPDDPSTAKIIARYSERIQSRFDEAFQTVGPEVLEDGYKSMVQLEQLSGSDPKVMDLLRRIKSGTGRAVDTEQYRALRAEQEPVIQRAMDKRDTEMGLDFYVKGLSQGEPPSQTEFSAYVKKSVRPGMSDEDIGLLYAAVSKDSKNMKDLLIEQSRNATMDALSAKMAEARLNPGLPNSSNFLNADWVSNQVRLDELALRRRLGMPLDTTDVDKSVQSLLKTLNFDTASAVSSSLGSLNLPQRAQLEVQSAAELGVKPGSLPNIERDLIQFLRNPGQESFAPKNEQGEYMIDKSNVLLGYQMWQEAVRQNVDLKTTGLEDYGDFFEKMHSYVLGGATANFAAFQAAAATGPSVKQLKQMNADKMRTAAVEHEDGLFTFRSTAIEKVDSLWNPFMDWVASQPLYSTYEPDQIGPVFTKWAAANAIKTSFGWVHLPRGTPVELRGSEPWDLIAQRGLKAIQKVSPAVTGIRFTTTKQNELQIFALTKDFPGGEFFTQEEEAAFLEAVGMPAGANIQTVRDAYSALIVGEKKRKYEKEAEEIRNLKMRRTVRGFPV